MQTTLSLLSDVELAAEVERLANVERGATVRLVAHLAEFDARRLYLGAGFPSLFAYCTAVLRLAEHAAYNRIEAARAARRFPRILAMLEDSSLNLATVRLLAPHLTAENHGRLLDAAAGKTRRGVEDVIASHFPRPDVPDSMCKIPAPVLPPQPARSAPPNPEPTAARPSAAPAPPPHPLPTAAARAVVEALAPDRYLIKFTASGSTCEKLRTAQDLMQHAIPARDVAEVIDRALTVLIEHLVRRKFAATASPGAPRDATDGSRHIPAWVRRVVWIRDGGRCAFVSKGGRRCNSRSCLEFHHVIPYEVGGQSTVDNIQLRCRAHNAYEGDVYFGPLRAAAVSEAATRPGASSVDNMTV